MSSDILKAGGHDADLFELNLRKLINQCINLINLDNSLIIYIEDETGDHDSFNIEKDNVIFAPLVYHSCCVAFINAVSKNETIIERYFFEDVRKIARKILSEHNERLSVTDFQKLVDDYHSRRFFGDVEIHLTTRFIQSF